MPVPRGRRVPLSPARRLVTDLMWACRGIPTVTVDRRADLSALVAARRGAAVKPMWAVIFAKAYAIVAAREPELRRSYISFPWAHFYEHAEPVAAITIEREYKGEQIAIATRLRHAHARPLAELDGAVRIAKEAPLEELPMTRRMLRLARLPGPLRRGVLWMGLHASGRLRERHSGTFGVTSVGSAGAGGLHIISPLTATLHYGMFLERDQLDLRLTFDHRVFDGGIAARALTALERVLNGSILDELRAPTAPAAAA
jgi:hypothetical protein